MIPSFPRMQWRNSWIGLKKDKKTANKIYPLIEDIRRSGAMQGIGKPEPLKHRPGYSRRIDEKTDWCTILTNCRILKSYHAQDITMIKKPNRLVVGFLLESCS